MEDSDLEHGLMLDRERLRQSWRPTQITTLFVGESPPNNGAFFYRGDTALKRYMAEAFGVGSSEFLDHFKASGCYLDDLVLLPVDHLSLRERKARCAAMVLDLAGRIQLVRPLAIVSLMKSVAPYVNAAMQQAGSTVPHFTVPFPGQSWQRRFLEEMRRILPQLPMTQAAPVAPGRD